MDWNRDLLIGLTIKDFLFIAIALGPMVVPGVMRALLRNRNKAASIAISLFGAMLAAHQAGDGPITGKEMFLMLIGFGLYLLGARFLSAVYREEGRRGVELQENERN